MNAIEQQVLRLIGEDPDAPDVFTDDDVGMAPVRDSVNEAIQEIVMLAGGYTETVMLPLRKSVNHYRLELESGYLGWVVDAWRWDSRYPIDVVTIRDLMGMDPLWMESESDPRYVFHVGLDSIGVWPRASSTSDAIELRMVVIPAEYTRDTDRIKVRSEFRQAIINYAVAEYWAGRGDARSATTHLEYYAAGLGTRLATMETADRVYSVGRNPQTSEIPARPGR